MQFSDKQVTGNEAKQGSVNSKKMSSPIIVLNKVVKTYENAAGLFHALKGVDLEVEQGEFLAIIGKSGSGKSTMLNMITGIDRPSSGEVWVSSTPLHTLSENQMALWRGENLGIVFQFFQLLPTLTVLENVMLPMDFCKHYYPKERRDKALSLLEMVEMADHAHKLPTALSGGQQQRVAIARSLANDPPLLAADEPTGNLDSRTADMIFELFIRMAARGRTIVMVTHDNDLASRVGRAVTVVDGTIVDQIVNQNTGKAEYRGDAGV